MRGRRIFFVLKLAAVGTAIAGVGFLHHGHIIDFLSVVDTALSRRLPKRLGGRRRRPRSSVLQVYFSSPDVHYEVCVQRKTRSLEIGLHFEGAREENHRWAQMLAPRVLEIKAELGPGVELEEWTRKWTRLHETWPVGGNEWRPSRDLTEELAGEVAERLARFIEVLEPILALERAGVAG